MNNANIKQQTSCRQCGECCTNGGAALHSGDLKLLQDRLILRSDLVTLRRGEFAHNPISNRVQATSSEIVKLGGRGGQWMCCYYDTETCGCSIYKHRPQACRTLKCWDPEESLALVERDLLSRFDILAGEDLLLAQVSRHEETCPLPDFAELEQEMLTQARQCLESLEEQVNRDIRFREQAIRASSVIAEQEMFLFGRPLFQLLHPFGFTVSQSGNVLRLQWQGS